MASTVRNKIPTMRPKPVRRTVPRVGLPTAPGCYYWSTWKSLVHVVKRGQALYVTPPGKNGVEVKITPNIAGTFIAAGKD